MRSSEYSTKAPFINSSCHTKCIATRYAEPDLNKGESVCVDRCVAKFFEVNKKVGERLQTSKFMYDAKLSLRLLTVFHSLVGANAQASGTFSAKCRTRHSTQAILI